MLKLKSNAASFFKREGLFQENNYDFVTEEIDGTIMMKMYYNNVDEIVSLIQRWMPLIEVQDVASLTKKVYDRIDKNHTQWVFSLNRK